MFLDDTACNLVERQPHQVPARGRVVRHRGLPARVPRLLHRAGDPRRSLELPDGDDRAEQPRLPPARPRLREPRQPAHVARRPVRQPTTGARSRRRSRRSCAATRTGRAPRWRSAKGPFPGFAKNREPMLRVMRMHRDAAYASTATRAAPGRAASDAWQPLPRRVRGLGRGRAPRRGARLPQRAGDGARPHGDHRPPDGLRHDGHRAGLRAREVQEARRRRLLQDRQPDGSARAPAPRLRRARGAGDRRVRLAARTRCSPRRTSTARTLKEKGLTDAELAKVEAAIPGVFDLDSAFATWILGEDAYERLGATKDLRAKGLLAPRAPGLLARADRARRKTSSSGA